MTATKQAKSKTNSLLYHFKGNVSWVLSLLTIIGIIFSVGRWSASLEYKSELNANNAKHYQEIATIKEEHMKELIRLQSEKMSIQNELIFFKTKYGKEENNE